MAYFLKLIIKLKGGNEFLTKKQKDEASEASRGENSYVLLSFLNFFLNFFASFFWLLSTTF